MKKRIKYKEKNNVLTSIKKFKGNRDAYYTVRLNLNEMTYEIRNEHQCRIIKSAGPFKNLTYLKRVAKRALMEMGVRFDLEIRDR